VSIVAGTVDSEEKTLEVAEPLNFPVAYGMTRPDGDSIGAWWDDRRDHIQPSEFILKGNRVMASTYSNSPVGRMDPAETLMLLKFIDSMAKKKA
jgi:hypothetical protein